MIDSLSIVRYCIYILKNLYFILNETTQQQYLNELLGSVQSLPSLGFSNIEIDMIGLPLLKKMIPLSASSHLTPVPSKTESSFSIWLYSPFQKKQEQNIIWVQNELSQVKVELANLTSFHIEIQSISLR